MGHRETPVQTACLQLLALAGVYAWRNNTGQARFQERDTERVRFVAFGKKGSADILGVAPVPIPGRSEPFGRFIAVETKGKGARTDAKRRAAQAEFAAQVRACGGLYFLVDDSETLEVELRKLGLMNGMPITRG